MLHYTRAWARGRAALDALWLLGPLRPPGVGGRHDQEWIPKSKSPYGLRVGPDDEGAQCPSLP